LKLSQINNWLQRASRLWTCSETRPRQFPLWETTDDCRHRQMVSLERT